MLETDKWPLSLKRFFLGELRVGVGQVLAKGDVLVVATKCRWRKQPHWWEVAPSNQSVADRNPIKGQDFSPHYRIVGQVFAVFAKDSPVGQEARVVPFYKV